MLNHSTYFFQAVKALSFGESHRTTSKTLLYHSKDPEKPRVLLLGPTGTAVNMGGTTNHFIFGIKPGIKLLVLNEKFKTFKK